MADDLIYRDADPSEDDECARIMYNAFLPIWNHNWFQSIKSPLDSIPSTSSRLNSPQARRLAFYRSWIALTRSHNGAVTIAYPRTSSISSEADATTPFTTSPSPIAAVVLLLPPYARPTFAEPLVAWRSGLLQSILALGPSYIYRVSVVFEGNVKRMIGEALAERNIAKGEQKALLHCQGCVRNPECVGPKGPARKLFNWAIEKWWQGERDQGREPTPVWLDTTTDDGVKAYEAIGFNVVGECMVDTGADEKGIELGRDASEEVKEKGRKVAKQRVMIRMPK